MPASPELVLRPDLFDVLESEVVGAGGRVTYEMSLSALPSDVVTVTVAVDVRKVHCYKYDDKFTLLQRVFEFLPSNWNRSQTVVVEIGRLEAAAYEGTSSASFRHSIESADENWKTAFTRSVSITLQDDSPCVEGAQKFETGSIRKCGCNEGTFVNGTDPNFCNSVTRCEGCPAGMLCGRQQILEEAKLTKNVFRVSNSSTHVVECPLPDICIGNKTAGDGLCRLGHEGPLCMICTIGESERFAWSGGSCVNCKGNIENNMYAFLSLVGLLLAVPLVRIFSPRRRRRGGVHSGILGWRNLRTRLSQSTKFWFRFARF